MPKVILVPPNDKNNPFNNAIMFNHRYGVHGSVFGICLECTTVRAARKTKRIEESIDVTKCGMSEWKQGPQLRVREVRYEK